MDNQKIKCPSCGNEFNSKHSYSNLGFKKYTCSECNNNFTNELTSGYNFFYLFIFIILTLTGIFSIINGEFPIIRGIFSILIGIILYKNYKINKLIGKKEGINMNHGFILIFLLAFFIALSSIMQGEPIIFNEEQKNYIGDWKGDGITLVIREDAYINYQKQKESVSSSVSGPIVEFNENDFKIGIGFMKSTFSIDKKPYQDGNIWKMSVDGNELFRATNSYELEIPEISELNKLTNDFFSLFNNSVYKDNYQLFYDGISKTWQSQTNVSELKNALSQFIINKIDLEKIIINDIVFSKPPFLDENNLLVLEGYYTGELRLDFKLNFIYEYPNWKIVYFKF